MDIQDRLRGLLLHHGPSPIVESFIAKERFHLDLNVILEETFRRVDLGPRDLVCRQGAYVSLEVELLLRHGASFISCDVDKLLEDTYRYIELGPLKFKRRAGVCLSPEVGFLLMQRAWFSHVPCGIPGLVDATTEYLQQSGHSRDNFLFNQVVYNRINTKGNWFLGRVYKSLLKSVDRKTLCHIVRLTSRQQDEIKIYKLPAKARKVLWPNWAASTVNHPAEASFTELRRRSDKVTVRVQGREITALRQLLQARSPYFEKLFNDNLEESSFEIGGSYVTIELVVLYAQSEPSDDSLWLEFEPCDSRDTTENTLNELTNILHAASKFEMADLFGAVEQHIVIHGKGFIYAKNVQEVKVIASEVNAVHLKRYCNAFITANLRTFTLFPSLPAELRMNIWRQIVSRPRFLTMKGLKLEVPTHIAALSRVCRESKSETQRVWRDPRMHGVNFEFDIIWRDLDYESPSTFLGNSRKARNARYCAMPAPYPGPDYTWEYEVSKIIYSCPCLKVLYLITKVLTDSDEFEYCRGFTNREPTTLVEARIWIEESAHQRLRELRENLRPDLLGFPEELREGLREGLCKDYPLPRVMLIDENRISRLAAASEQ